MTGNKDQNQQGNNPQQRDQQDMSRQGGGQQEGGRSGGARQQGGVQRDQDHRATTQDNDRNQQQKK